MDLAVLIILIILGIFLLKDVKYLVYLIGTIEIFLRLIHYIGDHLGMVDLNKVINNNFPNSLFSMLGKYTSGIIYDILAWLLTGVFVVFLFYLIKYLIRKK